MKLWHKYWNSRNYSWIKCGVDSLVFFAAYWVLMPDFPSTPADYSPVLMYWFMASYFVLGIALAAVTSALVVAEIRGVISRFKARRLTHKEEREVEEALKRAFKFTTYQELGEQTGWPKRAFIFIRDQPNLPGWHKAHPESSFWMNAVVCWEDYRYTVLSCFEKHSSSIALRTGDVTDFSWGLYQGRRISTDWHAFNSAEELCEYLIARGYDKLASRTAQEII